MIEFLAAGVSSPPQLVDGFIAAYQEAFAGPPYFESYSKEEVLDEVWIPHVGTGIVVLALDEGKVIGFGCAMPLSESPDDVRDHLVPHFERGHLLALPEHVWYMSELGVRETHRNRRLAYKLVQARLDAIGERGGSHFVMRTAAEGSNSLHLYLKSGAVLLPGTQEVDTTNNGSQSFNRIYLHGACEEVRGTILNLVA